MARTNYTITVLLPVHGEADDKHFDQAVKSLFHQTLEDFQVLLLVDGQIEENLLKIVNRWHKKFGESRFQVVEFGIKRGLGPVLADGLNSASSKYIARMDADDICEPSRLAIQFNFLESHPEVDVLGSNMLEFVETPSNIILEKRMPESHEEILRYAQIRNPINHPTAFFRRQVVVDCGGYRNMPFFEDYDLWIRLLVRGSRFHNVQITLLRYRVSPGFYARRRGFRYVMHQFRYLKSARETGFISRLGMFKWILFRVLPFLIPGRVQKILYQQMRSKLH